MSTFVEFAMPDGSSVILECDESDEQLVKAGMGKINTSKEKFEDAIDKARKSGFLILKKIREGLTDTPDEVELTFGLKASGELGNLVIAKTSLEANYTVKLTWTKEKRRRGTKSQSKRNTRLYPTRANMWDGFYHR